MKAWEAIAKTDYDGDVFCVDCDCRTPTTVFAVNADEIDGQSCAGCEAVFDARALEWNSVYIEPSAVEELKEACGDDEG